LVSFVRDQDIYDRSDVDILTRVLDKLEPTLTRSKLHPNPLPKWEREQEKLVLLPFAPCGRRGIAQGAFKKGG